MIMKCAIRIVRFFVKYSGLRVNDDQVEIYVYGLECFLNTAITITILMLWGIITDSLFFTLLWVIVFSLLRQFTGGAHAPTQFLCIFGSVLLGCLNKWAIAYLKQSFLTYIFFIVVCVLYAPVRNKKITLSTGKQIIYKIISIVLICVGFVLYLRLGSIRLTSTIHFSYMCVCILLVIAQFQTIFRSKYLLKDDKMRISKLRISKEE